MTNTIDQHRTAPEVTLDQYVRGRQIQLARSIENRTAIYLDTKYWIIGRDVEAGIRTVAAEVELFRLLRKLIKSGAVVCPISESIFFELIKQVDVDTRRATAQLIDELSLGVTLIPFDLRGNTELSHLIHSLLKTGELYPLNHLVWSKLSYVLGFVHPSSTHFDRETELAIQKAFFDHMWSIPLCKVMDSIDGKRPPNISNYDSLAERLNSEIAGHSDELRSFEQAYTAEICGAIDIFAGTAVDIVCDIAERVIGSSPKRGSANWLAYEKMWKKLLMEAFKKGSIKAALPTMHIHACLHACVRWDKSRKLKANDFLDFHHSSAALAYCDAFFTERPLRAMLTANHIALDKEYGCKVVANVDEGIEFLESLILGSPEDSIF